MLAKELDNDLAWLGGEEEGANGVGKEGGMSCDVGGDQGAQSEP